MDWMSLDSVRFALAVLGFAMIVEGLPYLVMPGRMKTAMKRVTEQSDGVLRVLGLGAAMAGFGLAWLAIRAAQ